MAVPACERSSRDYLHHGSAAWRGAARWRRRNLCLHVGHIFIIQHWAAASSGSPPLSPRQQDLHWLEDLLQKVSLFLVLQVHSLTHRTCVFSSSIESSTFCCSTGSEACVSRWGGRWALHLKTGCDDAGVEQQDQLCKNKFSPVVRSIDSTQPIINFQSGLGRAFQWGNLDEKMLWSPTEKMNPCCCHEMSNKSSLFFLFLWI